MQTSHSDGTAPAAFPIPVADVVATLEDLYRHQGKAEIADLIAGASARIEEVEYDNWNGGTYVWALRLDVPVPIFAAIEPRLPDIEEDIRAKLKYFDRPYPNDHLNGLTITPITGSDTVFGHNMTPPEHEVRRLWPVDRFRLFLSHVAKHKIAVSKLKDELEHLGVAAFVAHEAIEPTREWLDEIELGLKSMNALAALVTPDFRASPWTDQETGWALGRGILIVPVRLGADPYGFVGKVQGVTGDLEQPRSLAVALVEILLTNPQTHHEMRRALVLVHRRRNRITFGGGLCGAGARNGPSGTTRLATLGGSIGLIASRRRCTSLSRRWLVQDRSESKKAGLERGRFHRR